MKKIVPAVVMAMTLLGQAGYAQDATAEGDGSSASSAGASAANGVSFVNMTFEGTDLPPYMPNTVSGPVVSPTLFSLMGKPAQIAGLPVLSRYFFSTAYRDVERGDSGATTVVFNSARIERRKKDTDRRIRFDFSGIAKGRVIGSLTVQSKTDRSEEVDFPSVIHDATHYIDGAKTLRGYDVLLLSVPELISFSVGVDSKSRGLALSPIVSGMVNGPLGALTGLASGYSNTGGVTVPTALVGCTFLVVIEDQDAEPINLAQCFTNPFAAGGEKSAALDDNGNKRKEYASTRSAEQQ